jgi:hypothetical protein
MADLIWILSGRLARVPDDPEDVRRLQAFALVPTVIIMVLSITTYVLRLYCRRKTGQDLGCDDYLMGIGLLISLEPSICETLCKSNDRPSVQTSPLTVQSGPEWPGPPSLECPEGSSSSFCQSKFF